MVAADLIQRARGSCDEGETGGVLVRTSKLARLPPQEEW
jgi:hypothetical protein